MTGPKFGDPAAEPLDQVDEVRLYPIANPAPMPLEPGELPRSYGRNRLVLLPVDPYLIHVYWDLVSTVPPAAGARPILRFHESLASAEVSQDGAQTRPFDVDVDFTTSSWYVNLWSPDKVYYADLGWRGEDGSFLGLAQSNRVRTPPAWPSPAEPVEAVTPAVVKVPAPVAAPASVPTQAAVPVPAKAPVSEAPLKVGPPLKVEPPRFPVVPAREDTVAQLQRRLAELFAIRGDLPPVHEPIHFELATQSAPESGVPFDPEQPLDLEQEIPGEPSQLDAPMPSPWAVRQDVDLTQLSEERFTPGISSDLEGSFGK